MRIRSDAVLPFGRIFDTLRSSTCDVIRAFHRLVATSFSELWEIAARA